MRKIIQIVDNPETDSMHGSLAALCDDGSIWYFSEGCWDLFNHPIPQDDENE